MTFVDALAYDATGADDAPVLVLGSSLGTSRTMWQPQLEPLAAHFRVVRYDHLGHGASPVPAGPYSIEMLGARLVALLDALNLDAVSYAGVSLGGMVGMWLAAHHPERVRRLALLCTSAHLPPEQDWHDRARTARTSGTAALAGTVAARWFTPDFAAAHPEVVRPAEAGLAATPDEGYAGCCEAIAAMDQRPLLPQITAATLVVAGADDPATPPPHGQLIAESVPGARFEVVPRAAHLANLQRPEVITPLLVAHFSS
jgi:3-oxoadipate enol-lactonase